MSFNKSPGSQASCGNNGRENEAPINGAKSPSSGSSYEPADEPDASRQPPTDDSNRHSNGHMQPPTPTMQDPASELQGIRTALAILEQRIGANALQWRDQQQREHHLQLALDLACDALLQYGNVNDRPGFWQAIKKLAPNTKIARDGPVAEADAPFSSLNAERGNSHQTGPTVHQPSQNDLGVFDTTFGDPMDLDPTDFF